MESFTSRLKRTKILQWAVAYLAGAWLTLEVAKYMADLFGWPPMALRMLVAAAAVGVFVCLVLAWYHGEQGRQRVSGPELLILGGILGVGALLVALAGGGSTAVPLAVGEGRSDLGAPPEAGSIAVLPFANMSPDPADEYFSDGITDEILNALSTVPGLRVAARTSAFAFKGMETDALEIGRRLGVAYILEGGVRRDANDVRITAQLVDTQTGFQMWSLTFDHRLENIFQIQEQIGRAIVDELHLELSDSAGARLTPQEPRTFGAYDLYLRGRELTDRGGEPELRRAVQVLRDALGLDPDFAPALVALAHAYMRLGTLYVPPDDVFPLARGFAERALEIDPSRADPHVALAFLHVEYDWSWDEAEVRFRRALELDPGGVLPLAWYANLLRVLGRCDEAVARGSRAVQLDPLSALAHQDLGLTYYYCRRFEEAAQAHRSALAQDPDLAIAHMRLAMAYEQLGRPDDALVHASRAVEISGRRSIMLAVLGRVRATAGSRDEALGIVRELEARAEAGGYVDGVYLAGVYTALEDLDAALRALERAHEERSSSLVSLAVHPWHDPLRDRSEFRELLARMRLE